MRQIMTFFIVLLQAYHLYQILDTGCWVFDKRLCVQIIFNNQIMLTVEGQVDLSGSGHRVPGIQ